MVKRTGWAGHSEHRFRGPSSRGGKGQQASDATPGRSRTKAFRPSQMADWQECGTRGRDTRTTGVEVIDITLTVAFGRSCEANLFKLTQSRK